MIDRFVALIVDESKWLTASMGVALLAVAVLLHRHRRSDLPARHRVLAAMNLFFGVTIGTMAFGHLLAVTTKLASGSLEGSAPLLYSIGVALAVPSWGLIHHTLKTLAPDDDRGRASLVLNAWLGLTLLALGVHNLPLAAPAPRWTLQNRPFVDGSKPAITAQRPRQVIESIALLFFLD